MRLHGVDFPPVASAAGAQGFFGEGYWYHPYAKLVGLTFKECGFVAKTTTLGKQVGNMPLCADGMTPRYLFPRCIVVKPIKGIVLNAVGLSGPGTVALLDDGRWQRRGGDPFFLSFMSVQQTAQERLDELAEFVSLLERHAGEFKMPFGLELNGSCPNKEGLDPAVLVDEMGQALNVAARLGIPMQVKLNALAPAKKVRDIAQHEACDAVTVSNAIPWGEFPDRIDWQGLFGSEVSPLACFGGGGLSGWPLLSIVCDWIREARDWGLRKPIWACGGIDSALAVEQVHRAGASGVQFGAASMVRFWRTPEIIARANELFS